MGSFIPSQNRCAVEDDKAKQRDHQTNVFYKQRIYVGFIEIICCIPAVNAADCQLFPCFPDFLASTWKYVVKKHKQKFQTN